MKFSTGSMVVILLTLAYPSMAVADPCVGAHPVSAGEAAPCEGVLWPQPWSLMAVKCTTIDLPNSNAENAASLQRLAACQAALEAQSAGCQSAIDEIRAACSGAPVGWRVPGWVLFAGGIALGAAGAAYALSGL